jgi:hypothetical protein
MSPSATTVPIHEISIPSAVHGILLPPQLVKAHGAASTRAFLNEALFATTFLVAPPPPPPPPAPAVSVTKPQLSKPVHKRRKAAGAYIHS